MRLLRATFSGCCASGKHVDVTFSVAGQLIRAHRSVLCARSEYFDTMLGSQFREGESAHPDRSAPDEREGVSTRRKRKASGTEEDDGVGRTGTRMDRNAEQPLPVEEATVEEDSPFDQMRCVGRVKCPRCLLNAAQESVFPGGRHVPCGRLRSEGCTAGWHIGFKY